MKPRKEDVFRRAVEALIASDEFLSAAHLATMPQSDLEEIIRVHPVSLVLEENVPDKVFLEARSEALKDSRSFDSLNRALALRLFVTEYSLTPEMRKWISAVLLGMIERPASGGGNDRLTGSIKRVMTALMVYRARQLGLRATRSPASPPLSACDAVVEVLRRKGHHTTYDAVAKSWTTHAQDWMRD